MKDISNRLAAIEAKVRKLIQEKRKLQEANVNLIEQNKFLSEKLALQAQKVTSLEENLQVSRDQEVTTTRDTKGSSVSSNQLKKQIDEYVKEIDKCIEWLYNN